MSEAPAQTAPAPTAAPTPAPAQVPAAAPAAVAPTPPVAAPPTPIPAPADPAPVAAPVATAVSSADPNWLRERLDRNTESVRRQVLADLGVTDVAAARAAIDAARIAADANKSAEQRALEASQRASAAQTEAERLGAVAREHAARMMAVLTPAQQQAVRDLSPDTDPAGQLRAIGILGPTWAASAQPLPQSSQQAAETPHPAASTAPAPSAAPAPNAPTSPPDHRTNYMTLRQTNPFAAAAYGLEHSAEVYK